MFHTQEFSESYKFSDAAPGQNWLRNIISQRCHFINIISLNQLQLQLKEPITATLDAELKRFA